MRKILLVLFCVGLAGCATTKGYEAVLNSWVGNNESSLISSWGSPQNSYVMANGQRVIEYVRGRNVQIGGYTYTEPQTTYHTGSVNTYGDYNTHGTYSGTSTQYVTKQTPIQNIQFWCNTSFILDSSGTIQTWRWQGNQCVAQMPPKQKSVQPQQVVKTPEEKQQEISDIKKWDDTFYEMRKQHAQNDKQ